MSSESDQITTPVAKAAATLGAGAGSSAIAFAQQAESFFPTTLGGWLGVAAPTIAIVYTLHLLADFYWKRVWRPLLVRWGFLAPLPRKIVRIFDEDVVIE